MFKKILFATSATEASDHAARVAFNMAVSSGATLNIFHVLGVPTRGYSQEVTDIKTKEKVEVDDEYVAWVKEEVKTYYDKQMAGTANAASDITPNITIDVAVGFPHREILRQAKTIGADLIVLGRSTGDAADSVYKKSVAGSTIQLVSKAAACPVMLVTRSAASFWGGVSNIVFGTDFSKASDKAFDFAVSLAKELACELHIFHALDISAMLSGKSISQDEIEQLRREALRRIRGRYAPEKQDLQDYAMEVWEGIPFIEIVKYAREHHADLIVLAHHSGAVDNDASAIGSTVEQVIVRAGCPVVSMNK